MPLIGILKADTELSKVHEEVKNQRPQLCGTFTT